VTIQILIADDHLLMRQGILALIQNQPDMKVIAEAEDGQSAVELAAELSPQVVLMDITMPILSGIEATRRILAANGSIKVIALSVHIQKHFVLEMLSAGASGYVLKDCAEKEVIKAIRSVAGNRTFLSHGITDVVLKDIHQRSTAQS
jgi:two-component system response regulator NreC